MPGRTATPGPRHVGTRIRTLSQGSKPCAPHWRRRDLAGLTASPAKDWRESFTRGSERRRQTDCMKGRARAMIIAVFIAASSSPALCREGEARLACLSPGETRDAIQAQRLMQPFRAMGEVSRTGAGESIGIKLCRFNDLLVYDVMVLRHDGHVVHLLINAANGFLLPPAQPLSGAPVGALLPAPAPPMAELRPVFRPSIWRLGPFLFHPRR